MYVEKVIASIKAIVIEPVYPYETKVSKVKDYYTTNEMNFIIGLINYSEYGKVNDYLNEVYIFLGSQD